ncbi:MAG TPA: penicillin acylase family protein [Chitinophagales bacterium]|nr:penicillin acylase family protein [Chitinophagales bacterium]
MKLARPLFFVTLTLALASLMNSRLDSIPPLGKFLSPFTGFWQNAEGEEGCLHLADKLQGLHEEVSVQLDSQRVPHIFARNDHDLYFMQGYLTARDRLWQMEFMIRAASGRASEIFGEKALQHDRTLRRIGIPYAAKNAIAHIDSDTIAKNVLSAYSEGVNAYIRSLSYKKLPLEYKLLNYKPEAWSPYNSALLLKFMSNMLTGREYDFEYTNALQFLDTPTFNMLYPDFPPGIDPIVPAGMQQGAENQRRVMEEQKATGNLQSAARNTAMTRHSQPATFVSFEPDAKNGSNNWAVAGSKSSTGRPILCSDPHLQLRLPSIWYQQQLHAPGINAYGVSIPGAPGIAIGFNEKIAWGETNAERDVKDWYRIQFKDASKNEYLYDGKWLPSKKVVEEIKIRDGETFYDTVIYTHHGPVSYDDKFKKYDYSYPVALRWTAHNPSNELKAFHLLNRARNFEEYTNALDYYECPGQNFAFACADGDIAIKQQGKFILRNKDEGKFIQDGTVSSSDWKGFIPFSDNPAVINPDRGFVSSANQHPTDSTYPYYYHGIYEYYRNRVINQKLASKEIFSPDDMMRLQNNNYNLMAAEVLPYLLTMIEPSSLSQDEKTAFRYLADWNFNNDAHLTAPTVFTVMWDKFYELLWDEFFPEDKKGLTAPDYYNTVSFIITRPDHPLADNKGTPEKETVKDLVPKAFRDAVATLTIWKDSTGKSLEWGAYKGTRLAHWIPTLDAFNVTNLPIGGNEHIVNACTRTHGPSWRMVVALGETVQAWGIYPGGQSGNPGSPFYANFALKWATGEYEPLVFLKDAAEPNEKIILTKTIQPAK